MPNNSTPPGLADLPLELIEDIASYLDAPDMGTFRRTGSVHNRALERTLRLRNEISKVRVTTTLETLDDVLVRRTPPEISTVGLRTLLVDPCLPSILWHAQTFLFDWEPRQILLDMNPSRPNTATRNMIYSCLERYSRSRGRIVTKWEGQWREEWIVGSGMGGSEDEVKREFSHIVHFMRDDDSDGVVWIGPGITEKLFKLIEKWLREKGPAYNGGIILRLLKGDPPMIRTFFYDNEPLISLILSDGESVQYYPWW
jgi:hypothetical protein